MVSKADEILAEDEEMKDYKTKIAHPKVYADGNTLTFAVCVKPPANELGPLNAKSIPSEIASIISEAD